MERLPSSEKSVDEKVDDDDVRGDQLEISSESLASPSQDHDNANAKDHETEGEHQLQRVKTPQDVPPNGGYGWVCIACCFLINAHTWGLNSSYGVFLAYYISHNVFDGATPLEYAFVGGLSISMAMAVSPLATYMTKRFGTRTTAFIGVFFETASFIGASFAQKIWHLFLSQGVCFGWGMGFLFVASVNVPPQWFTTKRSFANAIAAAGSGLGGLMYSLAASAMIKNISLPWAFRILGIVAFTVNTTCALLIRDRNTQIGVKQVPLDWRLFKRIEFTVFELWGFFSMLGYVVLLFSLPNYADSIGLTSKQGSVINAVLQLGQMVGRPPVGYFSDSFGRINMSMTMTFLCGLFCLVIWIFAKGYGVLIFFAFISGCVAGTFWATVGPVGVEIRGLKQLPSVLSVTWLFIMLPTTFSEPMALEIVSGSPIGYLGAQLFAGFMYFAGALCLLYVRVWKIGELEQQEIENWETSEHAVDEHKPQRSSVVKRLISLRRV